MFYTNIFNIHRFFTQQCNLKSLPLQRLHVVSTRTFVMSEFTYNEKNAFIDKL